MDSKAETMEAVLKEAVDLVLQIEQPSSFYYFLSVAVFFFFVFLRVLLSGYLVL